MPFFSCSRESAAITFTHLQDNPIREIWKSLRLSRCRWNSTRRLKLVCLKGSACCDTPDLHLKMANLYPSKYTISQVAYFGVKYTLAREYVYSEYHGISRRFAFRRQKLHCITLRNMPSCICLNQISPSS